MDNPMVWLIFGVVLFSLTGFSILILMSRRYKRCPSNRILVIYGKVGGGSSARPIHGGAAFVIPLIQDFEYLSLEPIQIEIPLKDALSSENIRISVPSVFTVAIGTEPDMMNNAAIRLLGLDIPAIKKQAEDIIFGQLRQVVASMRIEEINRDRDKFLSSILESLEPELRKIGMVLINVNITDITDDSGYIEAIGKKAAAEAIQRARADVANELKKGEVLVAEAEKEKLVSVAENVKTQQIGVRDAQREQAVRIADLAKQQAVGEQQAAFLRESEVKEAERVMRVSVANANAQAMIGEREAAFQQDIKVTEAEQLMRISVSVANAKAVEGENQAKATVAKSNAELVVKEAEAYQLAQTRNEQSKAAVMEAKNLALAKAAIAEAGRIEAEQRAVLEAKAKAEKAKVVVDAEAVKERTRLEAEGEAAAIFAKLEAEARGQYEILKKQGEGFREIVDACGGADQAFKMLLLEHLDKIAETSAKAISNIKFDKIIVWEGGNGSGAKGSTAGFLSSLSNTLPPILQVMRDIGGIEFPETLVKVAGTDGVDGGAISETAPAR